MRSLSMQLVQNRGVAKNLLIVGAAIILLLDWLALDDITAGNEPNLVGEYAILAASMPTLLFLGYTIFKNTR